MKNFLKGLVAMFVVACQAAVPSGYDAGYNIPPQDTWKEPYDAGQPDTYVEPDTTDGSDATDGEDTYVPPKDVTNEPDSSGPKEGDPCVDENPCTEGTCWHANAEGEFECNGGEIRTCADGKFCTLDECEAETGDCLHFERDCGDGSYCDDDADKCVEVVEVPDCDDEVPCTVDALVEGICSHTAKNALCDDGDLCTDNTCDGKKCVAVAKVCNDGDACTNNTCEGDVGCVFPDKCADGEVCTSGVCEEPVVEPQPGESCNDNDPCTVTDRIKQNGECHGVQKECLDGDKCTQDGCVGGNCVYEAVNCADGKQCQASTGQCVVVGPQVGDSCNDFDSCTVNDKIVVGGDCIGVAKCAANQTCAAGQCVDDTVPAADHVQFRIVIDFPDSLISQLKQVYILGEQCTETAKPNYSDASLEGIEACGATYQDWGQYHEVEGGYPSSWVTTELSGGSVELNVQVEKPQSAEAMEMIIFHVYSVFKAEPSTHYMVPWQEDGVVYNGQLPLTEGWTASVWADGVPAKCEFRYNFDKNGTNIWCVPTSAQLPN